MPDELYDTLDELLMRIHAVRHRSSWRRRLLADNRTQIPVSTLRVLRAVEQQERAGEPASIGDVAQYLAVEHSTASRLVSGVVTAGLLTKTPASQDQRRTELVLTQAGRDALDGVNIRRRQLVAAAIANWPEGELETLVELLGRLVVDLDSETGA